MKTSWILRSVGFCLGITLITVLSPATAAQSAPSQGMLGQVSAAFSGATVVQQAQLTGNAIWHAGDTEDTGTVTLTVSADGSSQMQLALNASGQRTESQIGSGSNADCQWAAADGVPHQVDAGNCWKPMLWFLPSLSLQPSLVPNYLYTADLGMGNVGSTGNIYRHLQGQLIFPNLSGSLAADIAQQSLSDLGLDPVSLLPAVLAYRLHPNDGSPVEIAIEIRFSDYRQINGTMIPFRIQRYLNGALQLDIQLSAAQLS